MGIACNIAGEPQREETKNPKQKGSQPQKASQGPMVPTTRTNSHTTTRSNARAGALHPLRDHAPDQGHYTRSEEVHCLRIGCSAPRHKNKRGTAKPSHSPPQPA